MNLLSAQQKSRILDLNIASLKCSTLEDPAYISSDILGKNLIDYLNYNFKLSPFFVEFENGFSRTNSSWEMSDSKKESAKNIIGYPIHLNKELVGYSKNRSFSHFINLVINSPSFFINFSHNNRKRIVTLKQKGAAYGITFPFDIIQFNSAFKIQLFDETENSHHELVYSKDKKVIMYSGLVFDSAFFIAQTDIYNNFLLENTYMQSTTKHINVSSFEWIPLTQLSLVERCDFKTNVGLSETKIPVIR